MKIDFEAIKRTTDLVAVIEAHGVALKKQGRDYVGLCPFHDDRKPSLRVSPSKGLWRCMSCEAAGNVIQFVAKKEAVTDHEAAVRLLSALPGVQRASRLEKKEAPAAVPPEVAAELLGRVAAFYQRALFKSDRAGLDYLVARNLADPAMLESFQVGYCNATMKHALPKSGVVIEQLQTLGVLNEKGNEVFYGRVVVPIVDEHGSVVSLYGRKVEGPGSGGKLPEDSARHIYLTGGHHAVFNAAAVKSSRTLFIVESIFDCLSLWQAGYRHTVPLYGKAGWTSHHDELVKSPGLTEIVLALDNDEAGREGTAAAEKKIRVLAPACTVRVFTWPDGVKDANEFFSPRGAGSGPADAPASGGSPPLPASRAEGFAALLAPPPTTGKEEAAAGSAPSLAAANGPEISTTAQGFVLAYPNRKYEVFSPEKSAAARLKATVKALGLAPGRFHVETLDLYSARARRLFAAEAARLFRLPVEVTESDLDKLLVAAEEHVAGRVSGSGAGAPAPSAQDRLEALKLGRSADLIGEILRDLKKIGIVGEESNGLLLYLTMTSRKMADPLAAHVISGSGAGKSHLQDAVLTLCPEEDLIKLTSLSSQALFYKGEDSLKHKCLAVEEVAGASGARYAVRNLISAKKLTIETTIKNPLSGKMETQVNTVHGPTAVLETTTDPKTDPETKSRFIVTSIDESPEQTRAILEAQRHRHTLDGLRARHARSEVLRRHHAFQRVLRSVYIVNNYEPLLGYGDDRLVFRRDHPKYLHLILVVTFLHQLQRPVKRDEVTGVEYIETTLSDIAMANDLALELFGTSVDDLSRPGRELLERTAAYVRGKAVRTKEPLEKIEFCRRELREALGWSEYQLRTHLSELVELEYVVALGGRFGAVFTYRLINYNEDGARFVPGLKSVEQLRQEAELLGLGQGGNDPQPSCGLGEPRGVKTAPRAEKPNLAGTSLNGKHEVDREKNVSSPAVYVNGAEASGYLSKCI